MIGRVAGDHGLRILLGAVAIVCGVRAQAAAQGPAFEVASVKENLANPPYQDDVPQRSGNRITMRNAPLLSMVAWAYHLTNPNYEIIMGAYEKLFWDSYDIEALTHDAANDDALRMMFQGLLEDRFALRVHRETREMAAYDLVVTKGGANLTKAPARPTKISIAAGGISSWIALLGNGTQQLTGRGASLDELAIVLTRRMKAPVVNRTGITGEFDYKLQFSDGVSASDAPVLTTAIHELGLNIEKTTGSFEVLVIDHASKPGGN